MSECLKYSKYSTYLGFTLDSEVNCGKHIEKIADKARKRLKILKYLSGRDWGSDASTLRITYTTLVRPILEYGYQIFEVASPINLKKLCVWREYNSALRGLSQALDIVALLT
ncbi:uncharacterized protein TNIN_333561 [Trichonephila inaurata madagascariensis]|uniref:RNA-directed DNA polymerase from mobile element jockey n=1 Tax=Trichonephila inaurata madagascariensis TaxID=2747483 RepID=A0A8X6WTZ2_9ARAC|nr:uncharacterized protein TNIN_333561 [Trichonephila inaurata madagascariensis]